MKRSFTRSPIRIVTRFGQYSFFVLFTLLLFHVKTDKEKQPVFFSRGLDIQFQTFSPAYAAFEDEYLFNEFDKAQTESLQAGQSNDYFANQTADPNKALINVTPLAFQMNFPKAISDIEDQEAPSRRVHENKNRLASNKKISSSINKKMASSASEQPAIAISIGPVVAYRGPSPSLPTFATPVSSAQPHSKTVPTKDSEVEQNGHAKINVKKIAGQLELAGGIAFLGDLEVSWVVEGEEYAQGQIWLKEGYYEVPISALTGEIVISLFDENDNLVGEGVANLDDLSQKQDFDPEQVDIQVRAIDTSLAGRVFNGGYITSDRPVENAEVTLFGTDETSKTDNYGQYHFENWKTSESRTVALASKKGFWDSVYLIDSNQTHEVFLFPNDYMKLLITRLQDIGFESSIKEQGFIYGRVEEKGEALSGIQIRVKGHPTTYFQSYIAMDSRTQSQTAANGLFTLAGLENGEHELLIERHGKIIDRRIVVVEAGKVSPIVIELGRKTKKVKFFDPLEINKEVTEAGLRFFEDEEYLLPREDGRVRAQTAGGKDPALLEFAQEEGDENNIFINRNRRFEAVPVVNSKWFKAIKQNYKIDAGDGLAVGFVQSKEPFVVSVAESPPDDILYFDKDGLIIKPSEDKMPAGFILVGLEQGLHTVVCESRSGSQILFTDMVYNNHQSVSVIYKDLN